jgi:fructokinase
MLLFAVVGEALIDLVGAPRGSTFEAHVGGSPANVALGLARLGSPVTLTTRFGEDAFGQMIIGHLQASGVVVHSGRKPWPPTSLAVATLRAGVASYDFRIDWDVADLPPLAAEAQCLHTGSLATALPPGNAAVIALVRRERERGRVTVSYDPNVRPALLGEPEQARPDIEQLVGLAHVVKASDEDLGWLYPEERDEDVARRWQSSGPALVVVTRGGRGSFAVTSRVAVQRPAVSVEVVDTVGAGDAFTSGLLDGLRRNDLLGGTRGAALAGVDEPTVASLLDEAALVAALTCARPGADPPTRPELDAGAHLSDESAPRGADRQDRRGGSG